MREAKLPAIFQLFIDAGNELATRFVDDKRVALVSFTGSTAVGRSVAERVARRLGKVLLELGGNNAIIVDESADLKLAIPSIVFGAVGTAGQRCTTTRRVLVHRSKLAELEKKLAHAYTQIRIGNPIDPATLMGPLIDKGAVERYSQAIQQARAAGGKVVAGDQVLEGRGNFVAPTIILAENDWPIVQHETFAPVLYLIPFDSLEEAIAMQNASAHGLSSAIFTDRLQHAEAFLSAAGSDCGIANVNIGTSGAEIGGAFGGEKTREADASPAPIPGRPTCGGRPTPSTGAATCRWPRASPSRSRKRLNGDIPRFLANGDRLAGRGRADGTCAWMLLASRRAAQSLIRQIQAAATQSTCAGSVSDWRAVGQGRREAASCLAP
jgi:acyl-CoA reductase-like NAD-dependent aldehyde dehydrogenase